MLACPQSPRSICSAPRITTSGLVQILSMCIEFVSFSTLVTFVRLDSEHEQSDRASMNHGLPVFGVGPSQRSRFLVLTKRSAASRDEDDDCETSTTRVSFTLQECFGRKVYFDGSCKGFTHGEGYS